MSGGMLLLTIAAILVYCGLLQRVLDRMYLTDRQALVLIGAMLVGMFLPEITLGTVTVSVSALVPLGVCVHLLIRAEQPIERWRTLLGAVLTGGAVYGFSSLLPAEAETLPVDPMWLYGLSGGLIAWLTGRSRRGAFICGVIGVLLADVVSAIVVWTQGGKTQLYIGVGGIADAIVVSGVTAVLLCEILGEAIERIVCMAAKRGERK